MEINEEQIKKIRATFTDDKKLKEVVEKLNELSNKLDRTQKTVSESKKKLR